jgi:hypothetical protein
MQGASSRFPRNTSDWFDSPACLCGRGFAGARLTHCLRMRMRMLLTIAGLLRGPTSLLEDLSSVCNCKSSIRFPTFRHAMACQCNHSLAAWGLGLPSYHAADICGQAPAKRCRDSRANVEDCRQQPAHSARPPCALVSGNKGMILINHLYCSVPLLFFPGFAFCY